MWEWVRTADPGRRSHGGHLPTYPECRYVNSKPPSLKPEDNSTQLNIHTKAEAAAAAAICKFPSAGIRSLTGQLPQFGVATNLPAHVIEQTNAQGSAVGLMIETRSAIDNIESIAAVPGIDLLLIGSNDLSLELGVPGHFESGVFRDALEAVGAVCKKHGKVFGLAGIYDRNELHDWAINRLGVRFILAQQDSGWIAKGSKSCIEELQKVIG